MIIPNRYPREGDFKRTNLRALRKFYAWIPALFVDMVWHLFFYGAAEVLSHFGEPEFEEVLGAYEQFLTTIAGIGHDKVTKEEEDKALLEKYPEANVENWIRRQ